MAGACGGLFRSPTPLVARALVDRSPIGAVCRAPPTGCYGGPGGRPSVRWAARTKTPSSSPRQLTGTPCPVASACHPARAVARDHPLALTPRPAPPLTAAPRLTAPLRSCRRASLPTNPRSGLGPAAVAPPSSAKTFGRGRRVRLRYCPDFWRRRLRSVRAMARRRRSNVFCWASAAGSRSGAAVRRLVNGRLLMWPAR